jgi:hypothetical protein
MRIQGKYTRHKPRERWDEAFRAAGSSTHDELLLDCVGGNAFDREEWEWQPKRRTKGTDNDRSDKRASARRHNL